MSLRNTMATFSDMWTTHSCTFRLKHGKALKLPSLEACVLYFYGVSIFTLLHSELWCFLCRCLPWTRSFLCSLHITTWYPLSQHPSLTSRWVEQPWPRWTGVLARFAGYCRAMLYRCIGQVLRVLQSHGVQGTTEPCCTGVQGTAEPWCTGYYRAMVYRSTEYYWDMV